MNFDLLFVAIFYLVLYLFYLAHKEKFTVQHTILYLYKTKWGLRFMDRFAHWFAAPLRFLAYVSIGLGFVGMVLMLGILIHGTLQLFLVPDAPPVIAPVLPGVSVPGMPDLSFWHWIVAILVVAIVHEVSHGIYARLHKLRVVSSGFAFLGPILAAFVEPDEKELERASPFVQLSVLAAGPFSNILFGFVILAISLFVLAPLGSSLMTYEGVKIVSIAPEYPISNSTLQPGFEIEAINGVPVSNLTDFLFHLEKHRPGEFIELHSNGTIHMVELGVHPKDSTKAMLGVSLTPARTEVADAIRAQYGDLLPRAFLWTLQLFFWLYVISLGVGLFNLLPLAFLDGGRMSYLAAFVVTKNKTTSLRVFGFLSFLCLSLILVNLLPYLWQLLTFLFGLLAGLF